MTRIQIIYHVNRISTTDMLFRAVICMVKEIEKKNERYYERELKEYRKKLIGIFYRWGVPDILEF